MARPLCVWAFAAAVVVVFSTGAHGALAPGQKLAAEALVKQFSAVEFDQRQKAVEKLIALGPDVVPIVRKALQETTDNEVKLRCQMVLKGLGAAEATPSAKKAVAEKFGLDASKVTLHVKEGELDAVLQELAEQSGNARIESPKDWEGKPVTLDVTDVPYWEAVNRLCAGAKLVLVTVMDPMAGGGLQLAGAKTVAAPASAAGPADVRLDSVTLLKQYVPPAMPMNLPGAPAMTLALTWFHEDRLRPIETKASVTKIVTDGGRDLVLGAETNIMGLGAVFAVKAMRVMMGGPQGSCSGPFQATVDDLTANVRSLKSVEGLVTLTFGTGEREIKLEDAQEGKSVTVGKDTVTLTQFRLQRGWGFVSLKHAVDGKEVPARDYPAGSNYGIVLVDPNGNRHAPAGGPGGMFNMIRMGAPGMKAPNNVQVQVNGGGPGWMAGGGPGNPGNVNVSASFQGLPDVEGQWTVLYVVPETTTVKEFTFQLTDVSLP